MALRVWSVAAVVAISACGGGSSPSGGGTPPVDDRARVDVCVLTGATTTGGCDVGTTGGPELKLGDLTIGEAKSRDVALYNGAAGNVAATIQAVTLDAGGGSAANYQIAKIFRLDGTGAEIAVTLPYDLAVNHGSELRVRVGYSAYDAAGAIAGVSLQVTASHPAVTVPVPFTGNITGCPTGKGDCDGNLANGCEVDLQADVGHCGACATSCGSANATAACVAGVCDITCDPGFGNCDGNSANGCEASLGTDPLHCGACGTACDTTNGTAACTAGVCGIACNVGFGDCDGNAANGCETNLFTDALHCGACAAACSNVNGTGTCTGGVCGVTCDPGFASCDGSPANGCEVNLATDTAHCGACATACGTANGTASCTSGACAIACATGFSDCDGLNANGCEVNLQTDPAHCGACATACNATNGTATCTTGTCGITCTTGFASCDGLASNGCEVNLQSDVANCGACAQACSGANGTPSCASGACLIACAAGFGNCDADARTNGCETDLTSSLANCGACGNACGTANAAAACTGGACSLACAAGWADCDGLNADGCETSLLLDAANCGACGSACALPGATSACAAGACVVAACNPGFADCDGLPANGCEVDTQGDVNNCGACGTACSAANGTAACVAGACAVAACNPGFADCDGNPANGCEVNVAADPANCGTCGAACSLPNATPACAAGACAVGSCAAGWGDCNGSPADGCETDLTSDVLNCGACGSVCPMGPNANALACVASTCDITSCVAGWTDANGQATDGCECQEDGITSACAAPVVLGTLTPGATLSVSGTLAPAGKEEWFQVTFTGNTSLSFHPWVTLTANATGAVVFDIVSDCAGSALGCDEGSPSTSLTNWEVFYTASPGGFGPIPVPLPGSAGTVLIRVRAGATVPACMTYTLGIGN